MSQNFLPCPILTRNAFDSDSLASLDVGRGKAKLAQGAGTHHRSRLRQGAVIRDEGVEGVISMRFLAILDCPVIFSGENSYGMTSIDMRP